jgi:hypothetical protein
VVSLTETQTENEKRENDEDDIDQTVAHTNVKDSSRQ